MGSFSCIRATPFWIFDPQYSPNCKAKKGRASNSFTSSILQCLNSGLNSPRKYSSFAATMVPNPQLFVFVEGTNWLLVCALTSVLVIRIPPFIPNLHQYEHRGLPTVEFYLSSVHNGNGSLSAS